jgi:hypothetical protein
MKYNVGVNWIVFQKKSPPGLIVKVSQSEI